MELTSKRSGGGGDLKSLLATRQGTILVALGTAAIAALILVLAINHYRQSDSAANSPDTVLVARSLIQKGTSGSEIAGSQLYAPTRIVEKHISAGALTDAAALSGKVAVTNILPGQQLTSADFSAAVGVGASLASNQRAIAIPLDATHGLSGIVQAGDHVDVYSGFNTQSSGAQIRMLIPDVLVLQAAADSGGGVGSSGGGGSVVLAVNDNQAAEVAYASDNGKIWLVLRPGNAQNASQTVATLQSILVGQPVVGGKR